MKDGSTCYNKCKDCGYCNMDDKDYAWCEYYDLGIDFFKDTSRCEGYEDKEDE